MKRLSYFLSILTCASLMVACTPKKAAGEVPVVEEVTVQEFEIPAEGTTPAYTRVERPQVDLANFPIDEEGWITLFNGENFDGWRGYDKDVVPGRWIVEDGAIKFNGSGKGESQAKDGGDLIFTHKFKNFEVSFDWKVAKGTNSGVFVLAQEIKGEPIYISSPEYQILDNENHPDAKEGKNGNRKSASLYDMIPANPQNAKPFDEWNTGGIKVYKGSVFHYQNGETVVEYHLWTPQWTELLQASKFSQEAWPLAFELLNNIGGEKSEGYFGLQDHGDDVWYKNIRIKILD